ncbi:MAG TPA: pyridoxal phosphate-dependent aminotransferase family protein [Candidatus Angelobacter sp.]|nr:pyridoxal phosphate-dependent aminotransferase family protein [Candidatus Angelobacter sp.]
MRTIYAGHMDEAPPLAFIDDNEVLYQGRRLLYFSGCDYFRLARSPKLKSAAIAALEQNDLNVAASRATTGNHKIYARLEQELAVFFGTDTAVLLPDGYLAPLAAAQALAREFTHAFIDEFAHGALLDAARQLHCPLKSFPHRDAAGLKKLLARTGPRARPLILTDGMFAHDGSTAPLREYLNLLPAAGRILVDDAHGAGVLGATGRGTLEEQAAGRRQIIQCATLSKAFGAYGGVVLASHELRLKIIARSRVFTGTTPLPPPLAGAGLAALRILANGTRLRAKLFTNLGYTRTRLRAAGWVITETPGPIIRLAPMEDSRVKALKSRLLAAGIYPPYLKYSGASAGGIFRLVISSGHRRDQLDRLISALGRP